MAISDIAVSELLPHEPPMVLLDRAVSFDESSLSAEVDVHEGAMFCEAQGVPAWVGIEYMAQAVAAHAGYKARLRDKPPMIGYLLGTRGYRADISHFPLGATLRITIESLFVEMGLGAFACRIEIDGPVASATINVYQPPDGVLESIDSGRISR